MVIAVHVERPHLISNAVDHSTARCGHRLATVHSQIQVTPLGHVLNVDVARLVLRSKSGINHNIVNRQAHSLVGAGSTGDADVPSQIQVGTCSQIDFELLVSNRCCADGHHLGTCRSGIRSEVGIEVFTRIVPRDTIVRDVQLNGKACSVISVAVLLNVVIKGELGDGFIACIVQTSHQVDAARAAVNGSGQAAHRAITGHAA